MGHKVTIELTDAQWEQLSRARLERMDREKRYIEPDAMVQAVFLEWLGGAPDKPARPAPAAKAPAKKGNPAQHAETPVREQVAEAADAGRTKENSGQAAGDRLQGKAEVPKPVTARATRRADSASALKRSNGSAVAARPRRAKADPDEPVVSDEEVVKGLPEGHRYLRAIPGEPPQKGRTSLEERVRRYRYWLQHPQEA